MRQAILKMLSVALFSLLLLSCGGGNTSGGGDIGVHFTDIDNESIVANFTSQISGLQVQFMNKSTATDTTIVSWAWDFGDGDTSAEQNPKHTYGTASNYIVKLTVTSADGKTNSITNDISVDMSRLLVSNISESNYLLTPAGKLFAWGLNTNWQLLANDNNNRNIATEIKYFKDNGINIKSIITGVRHSFAIADDAKIYAWGSNGNGELGLGDNNNRSTPAEVTYFKINGINIKSIIPGASHTYALADDGKVYAWGDNADSQLGIGNNYSKNIPTEIAYFVINGINIKTVIAGAYHAFAIADDGKVYGWGGNLRGQLGVGDFKDKSSPVEVVYFRERGINLKSLVAGAYHTFAIADDGKVYGWGGGSFGQLGINSTDMKNTPTELEYFATNGIKVVSIVAGGSHSFALTNDGKLYAWGWNTFGQLGDGSNADKLIPTKVSYFKTHSIDIKYIMAGNSYTFALSTAGKLYGWGNNQFGELGLADNENRDAPAEVDIPQPR